MRIRPLGKLLILLLVTGFCTGLYRYWNGSQSLTTVDFLLTGSKEQWALEQVEQFNREHAGRILIQPRTMPSRDALHAILKSQAKPVLWSPDSPVWTARLCEAAPGIHKEEQPVFLRSPLVFVTTRQKADFLRPLLSGAGAWQNLHQLSTGATPVPWGKFRYSHADPLASASGMMTLGLVMADYHQRHPEASLESLHTDPGFLRYLRENGKSLVYDEPAQKGTAALARAYFADPSRYDLITAYESSVLEAVERTPQLAVIYPTPTVYSEHSVCLLDGPWVTPGQKAAAREFLQFLARDQSMQAGVRCHLRPARPGSVSLQPELARCKENGFQPIVSVIEEPPYTALNDAAYQWRLLSHL